MAPVFAVTTAPVPVDEHLAPALAVTSGIRASVIEPMAPVVSISEAEAYAAAARARSEAVLAELLEAEADLADLMAQQQAAQAKKPKTRRRK